MKIREVGRASWTSLIPEIKRTGKLYVENTKKEKGLGSYRASHVPSTMKRTKAGKQFLIPSEGPPGGQWVPPPVTHGDCIMVRAGVGQSF